MAAWSRTQGVFQLLQRSASALRSLVDQVRQTLRDLLQEAAQGLRAVPGWGWVGWVVGWVGL